MRKLTLVIATILTLSITSCVKNIDTNKKSGSVDFTEMNVPANFDWQTTEDAICDFTSAKHASKVSIFTSDPNNAIATFIAGEGIDKPSISLPKTVKSLTVKYEKENGFSVGTTLNVSNGKIQYTVPDDSKSIDVNAASDQTKAVNFNVKPSHIYVPSSTSMATLLFEDLWPSYGDYDLNDFAVNYRFDLALNKKNRVEEIRLQVRMNAVGGNEPFDLYLQLNELNASDIDDLIMLEYTKNTSNNPEMVLLNPYRDEPAIFLLKNIKENKNKPKGGSFLNVSQGYEIPVNQLVEFQFNLFARKNITNNVIHKILPHQLTQKNINFFIAKSDDATLKEIHIGGQAPSSLGKDHYDLLQKNSNVTDKSTDYYFSNTHLVWAISVPIVIPHAYEGKKFTETYLHFQEWAESGGANYADWYYDMDGYRDKANTVDVGN
ncbi:MAG: LruC domain-containing protein [Rikenellaceae bacterium]